MQRRIFLQNTVVGTVLITVSSVGLLKSRQAQAARPKAAFKAENFKDSVTALFGSTEIVEGGITLKAPLQAENSAVVPLQISTSLPNVEEIAVVVEKNPFPLASRLKIFPGGGGYFAIRIKMAETSKVYVYVKAGDKVHVAAQEIKVILSGYDSQG